MGTKRSYARFILEQTKGIELSDYQVRESHPNLLVSLLPSNIMLLSLNRFKLHIVISLALAIIAAAVLFYKYLDKPLKTLNQGALNVAAPILNTSAVVGFGGVVGATAGFEVIQSAILNIPGHPLISFAIATNIIVGITKFARESPRF